MFNYKKISLPMIFTTFFSYSTNKTESPCANSRYSQCLNCFSYLLQAVMSYLPLFPYIPHFHQYPNPQPPNTPAIFLGKFFQSGDAQNS